MQTCLLFCCLLLASPALALTQAPGSLPPAPKTFACYSSAGDLAAVFMVPQGDRTGIALRHHGLNTEIQYVDQCVTDRGDYFAGGPCAVGDGLRQIFTPALTMMDAAEFCIIARGEITLALDVHRGGAAIGPRLATSEPVTMGGGSSETVKFHFSSPVTLVPGKQHSFHLRIVRSVEATYFAAGCQGGSYQGGGLVGFDGGEFRNECLLFAEGIDVLPWAQEPFHILGCWLIIAGFAAFIGCREDKKRLDPVAHT